MTTPPLLDLFLELRRRNLPLGVPEYLAGLEALAAGFGAGSRAELRWMCQALWSKSPEENEQVAEALDLVLPREITPADLEKLAEQAKEARDDEGHDHSESDDDGSDAPVERESDAAEAEAAGAGRVELAPVASASADAPLLSRAEEEARRRGGARFDLLGNLPVPRRYFKRAWRYVRRMQRTGPAVELDVEGTVARRCREGVLVAPVLAPRRRNLASVLILVDEGGSMTPFRQTTAALVGAARHSGFARTDVCYFHDVIGTTVHRDPALRRPVALADAIRPFAGGGVLVVSDAGAARRRLDELRVARTRRCLATMRRVTPRIAWLNPVPTVRWAATTAEAVRQSGGVPMFPIDRAGMDAAMDVLRGRAD